MKGGTFRRIADGFRRLMGRPVTTHYKDPVTPDPRDRRKKRGTGAGYAVQKKVGQRRRWRTVPRCRPGSISYHDKLVRHFGSRFATNFRRRFIASKRPDGPSLIVPTAEDFAANPPWAFLSTGAG